MSSLRDRKTKRNKAKHNIKVLVLNSSYQPINAIGVYKAIKLVLLEKADIVHTFDTKLKSTHFEYDMPSVIRLKKFHNIPTIYGKDKKPSAMDIFRRDNYRCVYCGSNEELTIDHVLPVSKGGGNTWQNLVTACLPCNRYKGDGEPPISVVGKKPNIHTFYGRLDSNQIPGDWNSYLYV